MSVNLKKFKMEWIKDDRTVVMVGKRDTGKSFLVRDLLYYHQDIPVGTVISGSEGANQFYSSIVPPIFIHHKFRPEIISNYVKRQKKIVSLQSREVRANSYSNIDPRAFFIMDDCLYDQSWIKDENIRLLYMNGRHYKTLFIVTMQYAMGIPPNLRTNIDWVFILRETILANKKRLYEQYAGMFPNFDTFCSVMNACTENYECLVIHNGSKSNNLEDQVYWYKASAHPDFKLCAPEIWKYNSVNYEDQDDDEDDIAKMTKKKNQITINVNKFNV